MTLFGPLFLGLVNGAFYAMLSLGFAVIFGLMRLINFIHGAQYMLGAIVTWACLVHLGIGYWLALLVSPLVVGVLSIALERVFIARIAHLDYLYGFLLTYGLAMMIQGALSNALGTSGLPYPVPAQLSGVFRIGSIVLPVYRAWALVACLTVCLVTWFAIERTSLGATLRAATENPQLVMAFGINVPMLVTFTYGFGAALAALTGVLAAPVYSVNPTMGADLLIIVFAVVVIGGMGSIIGSVVTGIGLGVVEGLTKAVYPAGASTVVFVVMVVVLLIKPHGLFGRA